MSHRGRTLTSPSLRLRIRTQLLNALYSDGVKQEAVFRIMRDSTWILSSLSVVYFKPAKDLAWPQPGVQARVEPCSLGSPVVLAEQAA